MKSLEIVRGEIHGNLKILYEVKQAPTGHRKVHVICNCGNELDVYLFAILHGNTTSCGCVRNSKTIERNKLRAGTKNSKYEKRAEYWGLLKEKK